MAQVKLAEALLRRKELQEKVDRMRSLTTKDLYEVKAQRRQVTENIDDIVAQVPKITFAEFTRAFDHYAKRLRLVDAVIQQANWNTEVEVGDKVMVDYDPPEAKK